MNQQDSLPGWRRLQLEAGGRSLIEASAGTGKTWTIAVLYLRLLLEEKSSPGNIIVTTFSKAAASELSERLRARLVWALELAQAPTHAADNDPAADWLIGRWQDAARQKADIARLQLALAELDSAPVSTLHSLCNRILREHPFAAGSRFSGDALVDGDAWHAEIAADFKRVLRQSPPDELHAQFPQALLQQLKKLPDGKQIGQLLAPATVVPQVKIDAWPEARLAEVFRNASAGINGRQTRVIRGFGQLADFIETRGATWPGKDEMDSLAKASYDKSVTKAGQKIAATKDAFEHLPQLLAQVQNHISHSQQQLWQRIQAWALRQKALGAGRREQRSFDDLLAHVHQVLQAEAGQASRPLADALFAAWPVALVDEFQDTDGVQYGILDAIYRDRDGAPRGRMVMIGDPKQAIYRFRGGDIHSYLRAAASVAADARLSLAVNHRSSRAMVAAINQFYACGGSALDVDEGGYSSHIAYQQVEASSRRDDTPFCMDGVPLEQALHMVMEENPPDSKGERELRALTAAANDITQMLAEGRYRIGTEPLAPRDIAVLLPKAAQIEKMKALLQARGVPCVTTTRSNVFASDSARHLQVLLHAVLHAEKQSLIRAALATPLYGMALETVAGLDAEDWQEIGQRFHAWRALWQRRGVQALVDAVLKQHGARLLAASNGERVLTDLRHLAEILQSQADAGLGPHALLAWLKDERDGGGDGEEETREARELRIESEAPRVKLMTLHASKGLEFPVVFLPLMWAHEGRDESGLVALHDAQTGERQLRSDQAALAQSAQELQDERFRLLYVALTRSIYACIVHALPPQRCQDGKRSNPAEGTARTALDVMLSRIQPALDSAELAAATPAIAWRHGWNVDAVLPQFPSAPLPAGLSARKLPELPWTPLPSRHSFSTLTRGLPAADGSQADAASDEGGEAHIDEAAQFAPGAAPEHPQLLALGQLRGTAIGNAIHAIFEHRRVGQAVTEQPLLLRQSLQAQGLWAGEREGALLAEKWGHRIDTVLATPLAEDMPALGSLPASDLLAEMEFHFALAHTSLQALGEACSAHGEPNLIPQDARQLRGLMTGKIDLVFRHDGRFHVLDYKGNFLGYRVADYQGAALVEAMNHSHYRFQALLYTVALDRYLHQRLAGYRRDKHLGDSWYLFVRALGLAPDAGIWRQRFDDALISAVQAALPGDAISQEEQAACA
ncbi:MAG: UvrD-helicase domain-containing protein [Pseudomonadota bacterium]|nr:UvrD-helicase domain-containing protein [Pseudomonadota bacterium]